CQAGSEKSDAGILQGGSRHTHLYGYRTQRLERDTRGCLRGPREARRSCIGAVHVGRVGKRRGRASDVHAKEYGRARRACRRFVVRHAKTSTLARTSDDETQSIESSLRTLLRSTDPRCRMLLLTNPSVAAPPDRGASLGPCEPPSVSTPFAFCEREAP